MARVLFHKHGSIHTTPLACLKSYKGFLLEILTVICNAHRTGARQSLLVPLIPHSLDSNHTHHVHFCLRTFPFMTPPPWNTPSGDLPIYSFTIKYHFLKSSPWLSWLMLHTLPTTLAHVLSSSYCLSIPKILLLFSTFLPLSEEVSFVKEVNAVSVVSGSPASRTVAGIQWTFNVSVTHQTHVTAQ